MMAAEAGAGAEEGGSVSSAAAVAAEAGPCRAKGPCPPGPFPGAAPPLCSALGLLAVGSGPAAPPPATTEPPEPAAAAAAAFPPLPPPPPPPPPAGALGAVDEGDSLDGPEYEEEEVAIPLNAPPTNQ